MADDAVPTRPRRLVSVAKYAGEPTEPLPPEELFDIVSKHAPDMLASGTQLGRYVVDAFLGEGGGGTVYTGYHAETRQQVAIKVLHSEMVRFPTMIARFAREVAAVTQIRHPNIVEVFECGEVSEGRPYYVMELLEGVDLRRHLKACGRFSEREALLLMEPICNAVQAAHDTGFIHRDIKANNVMIQQRGSEQVVKLLDFGIAKLLHGEASGQGLTEPGVMLGTPHAMAPEQIRCERLDARADIYALGVLLFQLLTGQAPFQAEDPRQVAILHLQAPAPRASSLARVSPAVDAVILRCLEKSREKRFGSVQELLSALRAAVEQKQISDNDQMAVPALGVYFELVADTEEFDDALIEDISNVLDMIENALASRGFALPLRTSTALLGVRRISHTDDPQAEREGAAKAIQSLREELAQRAHPHPKLRVEASLMLSEAVCRDTSSGEVEVVGGALLEVGTWTEHTRLKAS